MARRTIVIVYASLLSAGAFAACGGRSGLDDSLGTSGEFGGLYPYGLNPDGGPNSLLNGLDGGQDGSDAAMLQGDGSTSSSKGAAHFPVCSGLNPVGTTLDVCGTLGFQVGAPWPGYQRCPFHAGRTDARGPTNPAIQWRAAWTLPTSTFSNADVFSGQPAIDADGNVYASTLSGGLMGIGPAGDTKWSVLVGFAWFGPSPTVSVGRDGCIYVSMDELLGLDPADGTPKWNLPLGSPNGRPSMGSSPAVGPDGVIHVAGFGSTITRASGLYAVRPGGAKDWTHSEFDLLSTPSLTPDGTVALVDSVGRMHELAPDGGPLWDLAVTSVPPLSTPDQPAVSTEAWMTSTIGPDGTVYVATTVATTTLYAVNPDGSLRWQYEFQGFFDPIAGALALGADGTLYVSYEDLYAFDTSSGTVKWQVPGLGITSPIVDGNGTIYVTDAKNDLVALTSAGKTVWTLRLDDTPGGPPAMGADGTLYLPVGSAIYAIGER